MEENDTKSHIATEQFTVDHLTCLSHSRLQQVEVIHLEFGYHSGVSKVALDINDFSTVFSKFPSLRELWLQQSESKCVVLNRAGHTTSVSPDPLGWRNISG